MKLITVCIFSHDADTALFRFEGFVKFNNVWMIKLLKNLISYDLILNNCLINFGIKNIIFIS
jgi:hypothetical protein